LEAQNVNCKQLLLSSLLSVGIANQCSAAIVVFEAAGADAAAVTPTRDAFRAAVGGGSVAGANGNFGGLRREINWDGVGAGASDPNPMPGTQFSARGAVFSTPGTGFLVSANAGGATPILFGFPNDFQAFTAQKVFTGVNSNIVDVDFFVPGTNVAATTSAFGVIFTDVEVADLTTLQFFDENDNLFFSRSALVAGTQGLTFLGGIADAGERIARVRITSGSNTIVSNGVLGNPNDDVVVMDDFLYATPVPEPATWSLLCLGGLAAAAYRKSRN
jgi:hypothetical protein